jgi:4-hydroxythreonine-4-phosphate dehydrogenase
MDQEQPRIAITMGDPAGCGPEIVAMALTSNSVKGPQRMICIGDSEVMRRALDLIDAPYEVASFDSIEAASIEPGILPVLDLKNVDLRSLQLGNVSEQGGQAAFDYILRAIDLALQGSVDAIVTSPINKEAMHLAGHEYDGHTEILAERTNTKHVTMMLASGHFRVTHVSTHVALREAIERCTFDRLLKVLNLTNDGLERMGISKPRLAVAGLNPHSGEGGIFGREEIDVIQPAIDVAREHGLDVIPYPVPPDTVFVQMLERKAYDAVIAQYHDQGHIAAKLVDFWGGVNITLGIPIIRTSVDHGTAYDIAWTGNANPESLINAIGYAQTIYQHWPKESRISGLS